jgi:hypothetical protein
LVFDSYDRASFPSRGAGLVAKAEWAEPTATGGPTFSQYMIDIQGALPVSTRLSLLGRLTLGSSSGDLPDHYYFFLGGTNAYFLFPDRQLPFAGLRTMQRFGRHLQSVQLGAQYQLHSILVGRIRWNAGTTLETWTVDTDLLTYGFDFTLAALTRFGNAAVSVAALDFSSLPRLVIDVGFPF